MLFRVVMVTTLLLVATYVEAFSETLLAHNPLHFVIIGTYALTLVHALALRLLPRQAVQAYVQLILDLVTITALVYVTGGVRTGFLLLYPLSLLSATMLVPRRGALGLAGLATVLYGALIAAVRLGLPAPQGLADVQVVPPRALVYAVFVLGVACATVVLLGAYLAESVRHAGRQLHEAAVQVADLRELNQVIIDSIQSGLMTTDGDGRILYVNAFGERILGRPAASVRGAGVREVFGSPLLGPAELRARSALRALARLGVAYAQPDGRTLQLGVSVTPLATKEAPRGHLIVFQDLTDIRRLEQEVRTKEKLAAVGEMAAQLAHEIRNPLGSIRGSAQVLMGEPALGEEQGHLLDIISRESKRLSDTLNQFLYQARPQQPPADPVDLRPIVESALTLLRNGSEVRPDHVDLAAHGRGAAPVPGRPRPDHSGALEPRPQRARGDAGRRSPRRVAARARRGRGAHGARPGPGDRERGPETDLRALPRAGGAGHGARALDRLPHRARARRRHQRAQRTPAGHRVRGAPAAGGAAGCGGGGALSRIMVVDDEKSMRELLAIMLRKEGYDVVTVEGRAQAAAVLATQVLDMVITDVRLRDGDGIEILRHVKAASPETVVVVMTAFGTTETAVAARKLGAEAYVLKPFDVDELRIVVRDSLANRRVREENVRLKQEVGQRYGLDRVVGVSSAMAAVFEMVRAIAPTSSTVLITGESGTGKELVARAIHGLSTRSEGPFVGLNCGALPDSCSRASCSGTSRELSPTHGRARRVCSRPRTAARSCSTRWARPRRPCR